MGMWYHKSGFHPPRRFVFPAPRVFLVPMANCAFQPSIHNNFYNCCHAIVILMLSQVVIAAEPGQSGPVDFNRDVRPILNQHCVACHGGVKQAADLSFVYGDQALTVIEPGAPEDSYFLDRVLSDDLEERMPPAEHGRGLNEEEIRILTQWIAEGAEWGVHWAFVPPQIVDPPVDPNDLWSRGRIDHFIYSGLKQANLSPSPDASPSEWLRRVTLDLTGLPPTLEQRSEFLSLLASEGETAFAATVDRLLQSPAYGERWASVWLDVVRYADSRGLGQDGRRTIWKYRDWVIKAFNEDMPFDQFTIKQFAGDLLPNPTHDDLVATACQRLTQTNEEGGTDDEEFRVEAVIDRVNTTWQAWLGVSFGCVQCHSHPYEPIRHEEYYQFLAYLNNSADCDLSDDEPTASVPLDPADYQTASALERQIRELQQQDWQAGSSLLFQKSLWRPIEIEHAKTNNSTRVVVTTSDDGHQEVQTRGTVAKETTITIEAALPASSERLTAFRFTGLPGNEAAALKDSEWGFVLSHFKAELLIGQQASPAESPEDQPEGDQAVAQEIELAYVIADEPEPLQDPQLSLNAKRSEGFGAYSRINHPRSAAFVLAKPLSVSGQARLRITLSQNVFELGAFPLVARRIRLAFSDAPEFSDWWHNEQLVASRRQVTELVEQRRKIPSTSVPVMQERFAKFSRPSFVFDRGNFLVKTDSVHPKTPDFVPLADEAEPSRLTLAKWIASPDNPLTARVAVNRFWAQMFGNGIVETQEDFGSSGEPPSHPQLLDDLADRFSRDMNWSIKALLREIALSSTYRQTAITTPEHLQVDPRNRLLSRGPRGRLPAETVRDQALAISGLLSSKQFGPPVRPPIPDGVWLPFQASDKWVTPDKNDPDRYRRTVYTYIKRTIPFPIMASFDAPSREFCAPRRLPSNTPLQALMTLNDVTFAEASQALASRMLEHNPVLARQLKYGFLLATCRKPTPAEMQNLLRLTETLADQSSPKESLSSASENEAPQLQNMTVVASVLLNLDEVLSK